VDEDGGLRSIPSAVLRDTLVGAALAVGRPDGETLGLTRREVEKALSEHVENLVVAFLEQISDPILRAVAASALRRSDRVAPAAHEATELADPTFAILELECAPDIGDLRQEIVRRLGECVEEAGTPGSSAVSGPLLPLILPALERYGLPLRSLPSGGRDEAETDAPQ